MTWTDALPPSQLASLFSSKGGASVGGLAGGICYYPDDGGLAYVEGGVPPKGLLIVDKVAMTICYCPAHTPASVWFPFPRVLVDSCTCCHGRLFLVWRLHVCQVVWAIITAILPISLSLCLCACFCPTVWGGENVRGGSNRGQFRRGSCEVGKLRRSTCRRHLSKKFPLVD